MINDLLEINKSKINTLENKIKRLENDEVRNELKIQNKINEMFTKYGNKLFFVIDMEMALEILSKLVDENEILETYEKLISIESFLEN